jgi:hypothetical protein
VVVSMNLNTTCSLAGHLHRHVPISSESITACCSNMWNRIPKGPLASPVNPLNKCGVESAHSYGNKTLICHWWNTPDLQETT